MSLAGAADSNGATTTSASNAIEVAVNADSAEVVPAPICGDAEEGLLLAVLSTVLFVVPVLIAELDTALSVTALVFTAAVTAPVVAIVGTVVLASEPCIILDCDVVLIGHDVVFNLIVVSDGLIAALMLLSFSVGGVVLVSSVLAVISVALVLCVVAS